MSARVRGPGRSLDLWRGAYGCEVGLQRVDRRDAYPGAVEVRPFQAKIESQVFLRRKGSQLKR